MNANQLTDYHVGLQLFPGYNDEDIAIFQEFVNRDAKPEPGFVVDFLGCRIRTSSLWKKAKTLDGTLLGAPVPGDFHAETIEWIGFLKAVRSASGRYVAMELGAGFGPWSVAGGVAARLRGVTNVRLCAVEGDSQHFQWMRQHFWDNGFDPEEHALFEAAVGARAGVAAWPLLPHSSASEDWGCRPLQANADYRGQRFQEVKHVDVIPMLELVRREPQWDLIHIDVQGDEVDLCRSCLDELTARVKRVVTATHSRKIDGDLLELMWRAGWVLEHEKPAKFTFASDRPTLEGMITLDGTQVWRNPQLANR